MKIRIQDYRRRPFQPSDYVLDEGLRHAVELAIALGQPLLLTGEPGTGKTTLAAKVAHDLAQDTTSALRFLDQPLKFTTKSSSTARDLFYTYDALGHFQAANLKREPGAPLAATADFIELSALGLAIALSDPAPQRYGVRLGEYSARGGSWSSVVLIDEIDKAPRDFPNDILNEIEQLEFAIKELDGRPIAQHPDQRVVTILTSNSEKNLPDAFLRRCVFYHIPFPAPAQLLAIAQVQLGLPAVPTPAQERLLQQLVDYFYRIRELSLRKPPATAELIAWLRMMGLPATAPAGPALHEQLLRHLALLVKTREDLVAVRRWMDESFIDWYAGH